MKRFLVNAWLFALIIFVGSCSTKKTDTDDVKGAWMYFDDSDMYVEVLISDKHFITHNEVVGTTVSKILEKNRSTLKISDFDDSPVEYNIQFNSDDKLVLSNEREELVLTPIVVSIDIEKFASEDFEEMDKYDEGFESRKRSKTDTSL